MRLLARLKAEGVAILYISHRMHEVEALADRASVFRNGRHIETFDKGARSTAEIVQLMIGRDIATQYPPKPARAPPAPALKVENLGWEKRLDRHFARRRRRARSSASAASTGRARRRCCSRSFGVLRGVTGRRHGQRPRRAPRLSGAGQVAGESASRSFPRIARPKG